MRGKGKRESGRGKRERWKGRWWNNPNKANNSMYKTKNHMPLLCSWWAYLSKERAERSIEIIRKIEGKYGLQLNEENNQCIIFNTKQKWEKISNIEEVEELKYLEGESTAKRNLFEWQKKEMKWKKIKRLSTMTNPVIEKKKCHRVLMEKNIAKRVALPSVLCGSEVIDINWEDIDKQRTQQWEEFWRHRNGQPRQQ